MNRDTLLLLIKKNSNKRLKNNNPNTESQKRAHLKQKTQKLQLKKRYMVYGQ